MLILSLLVLLKCSHGEAQNDDYIEFLADRWLTGSQPVKFVRRDQPLIVSCQTNSPHADVYLLQSETSRRGRWTDALYYSNGGITRIGQTFLIKKLSLRHSGHYKCKATNWRGEMREIQKGRLIVNAVPKRRIPEIFPDVPVIRINKNGDRNITCKTTGAPGIYNSYLTWYKQNRDGTVTEVDEPRVIQMEERVGGNIIDVAVLMFRMFTEDDGGAYVCERRTYLSNPTQKVIRVVAAPIFEFKTKKWGTTYGVPVRMAVVNLYFFISCQTSDTDAAIYLFRKQHKMAPWRQVSSSNRHIVQVGQTFSVRGLRMSDTAYYKCRGVENSGGTIELEKGLLIVGSVPIDRKPEIFPNSPTILIRRNSVRNITCKAVGAVGNHNSFLRWYKDVDGKSVYVKTDNVYRTGEDVGGNHVDIEKLMFKKFTDRDVGVYLCVRKVLISPATESSVNVGME